MADSQQVVNELAFVYGKSGGWWGQLRENVRLILASSLKARAIKALDRGVPLVIVLDDYFGLTERFPHHQGGHYYRKFKN